MDIDNRSNVEGISSFEISDTTSSGKNVEDISDFSKTDVQRSEEHSNEENTSHIGSLASEGAEEAVQVMVTKSDADLGSDSVFQDDDTLEVSNRDNPESAIEFPKPEIQDNKSTDEPKVDRETETLNSNAKENLGCLNNYDDDNLQSIKMSDYINKEKIESEPKSETVESQIFNTNHEQTEIQTSEIQSVHEELKTMRASLEENFDKKSITPESYTQDNSEPTENNFVQEEKLADEKNEETTTTEKNKPELISVVEKSHEGNVDFESETSEIETQTNEPTENKNAEKEETSINKVEKEIIQEEVTETKLASDNIESNFREDIKEKVDDTISDTGNELQNEIKNTSESVLDHLVTDSNEKENSETVSTPVITVLTDDNTAKYFDNDETFQCEFTSDSVQSMTEVTVEHASEKEKDKAEDEIQTNKLTSDSFSVNDESKIPDLEELTANTIHEVEVSSKESIKEEIFENESTIDELQVKSPEIHSNEENIFEPTSSFSTDTYANVINEGEVEELKPDNETASNEAYIKTENDGINKDEPEHDNSKYIDAEDHHENISNFSNIDSQINEHCNKLSNNELSEIESLHLVTEFHDNTFEEKLNEEKQTIYESPLEITEHNENVSEETKYECDSYLDHSEIKHDEVQTESETNSAFIFNESQNNDFSDIQEKTKSDEISESSDSHVNISFNEKDMEQKFEIGSTYNEEQIYKSVEDCSKEETSEINQTSGESISLENCSQNNEIIKEISSYALNSEDSSQSNVEDDLSSKTPADRESSTDVGFQNNYTPAEHPKDIIPEIELSHQGSEDQSNEQTEFNNKEKLESEVELTAYEFQESESSEHFKNETNETEIVSTSTKPQLDKITQKLENCSNYDETLPNVQIDHQANKNVEGTEREH